MKKRLHFGTLAPAIFFVLAIAACNRSVDSATSDTSSDSSSDGEFTSEDYDDPLSGSTEGLGSSDQGLHLNDFFSAVLPVASGSFQLSSAFGPRLKASEGYRYDFHRGIDIPGSVGESVFSIADGQLFRAYPEGSSVYPNGGNVVVIRHELPHALSFHGQGVTRLYAIYMHLNSFGAAAQTYLMNGTQESITAGDVIGTMGRSGETTFTHLHFEIRLGTTCSLEFQRANPTASCAGFGFDPHVNPIDALMGSGESTTLSIVSSSHEEVHFSMTAIPDHLNVNGLVFTLQDTVGTELLSKTLDFDLRIGFDATSTSSLDNPAADGCTISPAAFNTDSALYQIDFTCAVPASLWTGRDTLIATGLALTTQGPGETRSITIE